MTVMPFFRTDADGFSNYPMMRFKTEHTGCEGKDCWHTPARGLLVAELLGGNGPHNVLCEPQVVDGALHDPCEHGP